MKDEFMLSKFIAGVVVGSGLLSLGAFFWLVSSIMEFFHGKA